MDINHNIKQEVMERYFSSFCNHLEKKSNAREIELTRVWVNKIPKKSGVYLVFDEAKIIYVGESGNLSGRMTDMLDSRHHVLRRNLGSSLYENMPKFEKASVKSKFPQEFEDKLNEYIQSKLMINIVTVELGRKEIEERLIEKHKPSYNRKGKRAT